MFLKNLVKKAKTAVDTTEEIDNHFFGQVMEEIENGFKDKNLHGKAIAMSGGDEAKTNSIYIELRAKALQEEYIEEQNAKYIQKAKEDYRVNSAKTKKNVETLLKSMLHVVVAVLVPLLLLVAWVAWEKG